MRQTGTLTQVAITNLKAYQDESEPEKFGVAIGKNNVALQSAINKAIDQLTEEGFFEENIEFWFGAN